jgi:hypothetical protein
VEEVVRIVDSKVGIESLNTVQVEIIETIVKQLEV